MIFISGEYLQSVNLVNIHNDKLEEYVGSSLKIKYTFILDLYFGVSDEKIIQKAVLAMKY